MLQFDVSYYDNADVILSSDRVDSDDTYTIQYFQDYRDYYPYFFVKWQDQDDLSKFYLPYEKIIVKKDMHLKAILSEPIEITNFYNHTQIIQITSPDQEFVYQIKPQTSTNYTFQVDFTDLDNYNSFNVIIAEDPYFEETLDDTIVFEYGTNINNNCSIFLEKDQTYYVNVYFYSSLEELPVNKKLTLYIINSEEEIDNSSIVNIYHDNQWKKAIPYIYTNEGWKQAKPYIYDGTNWKETTV